MTKRRVVRWTDDSYVRRRPLGERIARLKKVPIREALALVAPGVDFPRTFGKIRCPLVGHNESTPSFHLYPEERGWYCWGCQRGGRLIEFVVEYHGITLEQAVTLTEEALGVGGVEDGDLTRLVVAARRGEAPEIEETWGDRVRAITETFMDRMLPYLRCADPLVVALTEGPVDMVLDEHRAALLDKYVTKRAARESLRRLGRWTDEWAQGIEDHVRRALGKDPRTVREQAPEALVAFDPEVRRLALELIEALVKARQGD